MGDSERNKSPGTESLPHIAHASFLRLVREDKKHILYTLDALIKNVKLKAI